MGALRISFQLVPLVYTLSILTKTRVNCSLRTQKSLVRALANQASSSAKMVKGIRVHEHGGPEVYTSLSLFLLFVIGFMESFDFKV